MNTYRVFKFGADLAPECPNTVQVAAIVKPCSRSNTSLVGRSVLIEPRAAGGEGSKASPCAPDFGDDRLAGRTSRSAGNEHRVAPARLGGNPRDRHRAAGIRAGNPR